MLVECRLLILIWQDCVKAALEEYSGAPTYHGMEITLTYDYTCLDFLLSYYNSPEENSTNNFSTDVHYVSLRSTLQQIDIIHALVEKYPDDFRIARTSAEIWDAFKSGQIASLIGVEGLHQIANSASVLRIFHRLGVRYVTLTHDSNNLYADSTVSNYYLFGKESYAHNTN